MWAGAPRYASSPHLPTFRRIEEDIKTLQACQHGCVWGLRLRRCAHDVASKLWQQDPRAPQGRAFAGRGM